MASAFLGAQGAALANELSHIEVQGALPTSSFPTPYFCKEITVMNRCPKNLLKSAAMLVALCAVVVACSPARAVTRTWNKFGSGNFNDPNNWFSFGVPGANDFVSFEIGMGFPYTVTFPGNELVNDGGFGGGSGTANYATRHLRVRDNGVTFSGSTQPFRGQSTYTVGSTTQTEANRGIIIGLFDGENASLSISHNGFMGGVLSSFNGVAATLGDAAGAAGTLNMNVGAFNVTGSDFTQTQLIVGNHGVGALNVNSGADVNVPGSNSKVSLGHHADGSGAVTISGAGSTFTSNNQLWVGELGSGALTVKNGGALITSSPAGFSNTIGTFAGSSGMVTVTGAGSTWTNSNTLHVGNSGSGALTIANGGRFIHTNGFVPIIIESDEGGTATVTGPGSSLTTPGTIYVGSTGKGSLGILNGGSVNSGRALIRGLNDGSGEVLVSGAGSTWNVTNVLEIGMPEPGFTTGPTSLTINPGATVSVGQEIDLDTNGLLRLQGGTLTAKSIRSNDLPSRHFEGTFEWTSGTLHVGTVHGSVTNQGGTLAPGLSAGITAIDGDYTQQAAGALEIEIGGTLLGDQYDFVHLDGVANLNGTLQLAMINGFEPTTSQSFPVLQSFGITGAFSNVATGQRLATVDGLGSFQVNYGTNSSFSPNRIVLSNFALSSPGDFNGDGNVDGADLDAWQDGYGENGSASVGKRDADGDLDVDGNDFLDWQRNVGRSAGSAAGARVAAVPEPATLALAGLALCSLAFLNVGRPKAA